MSKRQKRLVSSFKTQKQFLFSELTLVLSDLGFEMRSQVQEAVIISTQKGMVQISIPYKRPYVKEIYIKRVLELVEGKITDEKS